ncbi:hypothetical protein HDU82_001735 [Entophlyctis luteolus]|nr:hypothetical protein HDU82_001735 [Entophlyctis luteolus]
MDFKSFFFFCFLMESDDGADWLHSDSDSAGNGDVDREILALQRVHGTNGYREGMLAGKEAAMQRGFDEGYAQAFLPAWDHGVDAGRLAVRVAVARSQQQKHQQHVETDGPGS